VDPTARLLGPVLLGPRVQVRAGATLVGPVTLGPGTTVEADAVVSRSVVWSGCVVGHGAFVDRCMLADGATIEPGKSVFSIVRTAEGRGPAAGLRDIAAARSLFRPVVAALRPAVPHHS
jgi:NDP-sugar pyrophosphorylase family protein